MICGVSIVVAKQRSTKRNKRSSVPQAGSDRPHSSGDPLISLMRR
jgi:hypothetical protein